VVLQGVRAVLAESFERIHRSNLVGMGIIPLQYKDGDSADSLQLTGHETFTIDLPDSLHTQQDITVHVSSITGSSISRGVIGWGRYPFYPRRERVLPLFSIGVKEG